MVNLKNWKPAIYTAVCVGIGSQISINAFTNGFIITLAVVLLGVFLSQYENINPLRLIWATAFWSPFFRGMIEMAKLGDLSRVFWMVVPDVFFYLSYGVFFYFIYCWKGSRNKVRFFVAIIASDCLANVCEMTARLKVFPLPIDLYEQLFEIACVRCLIIFLITIAIKKYRALLMSEEHEARYKKLLVMASVFNSEVYFMNKNMVEIEDVMQKAFTLYRSLDSGNYPREKRRLALDIAKDVHEIKKDYIRVIQGLQNNFLSDIKASEMSIGDIVQILDVDINEQIKAKGLNIYFTTEIKSDFTVSDHFSLMSILRNLIMNSIEALDNRRGGLVELSIKKEGSYFEFVVYDNGPGIRKEEVDVIYDPGFSTKFDYNTGDINRGVGLTLVRNLIEDVFDGSIMVQSEEGSYTKFIISIPCESMRGENV